MCLLSTENTNSAHFPENMKKFMSAAPAILTRVNGQTIM
jgi:hypothetical protein